MSTFSEKELTLLQAGFAHYEGGVTALKKVIDFKKVAPLVDYKDATNAKIMFGRLIEKILKGDLQGAPGRAKPAGKAKGKKKGGSDEADTAAVTPPSKSVKKRKMEDESDDGKPKKRGRTSAQEDEEEESVIKEEADLAEAVEEKDYAN